MDTAISASGAIITITLRMSASALPLWDAQCTPEIGLLEFI